MQTFQSVLAVETSCDDTSAAIVRSDGTVEVSLTRNQNQAHAPFGGIVPEIASRNHSHHLLHLIEEAFQKTGRTIETVDGLVVTSHPGLIGSLMVGLVTIKTLSMLYKKPFIGVNHLEGHIMAPLLRDDSYQPPEGFEFPFVALTVSGGHTSLYLAQSFGEYRLLGQTIDDAAGEAFDKFAKIVGLGYPGGVEVDRLATSGELQKYDFPRALLKEESFRMSFSGLKTSAQRVVESLSESDLRREAPHLCASYQEAIVDVLVAKLARATSRLGVKRAVITGGVSANSRLRARAQEWASAARVELVVPPLRYCTDNAAMIGYAGIQRLNRGERSTQDLGPRPKATLDDKY